MKVTTEAKKLNRSSDVIILDESFEKLRADFPKPLTTSPKIYSPILISDSSEFSHDELPEIVLNKDYSFTKNDKEPSKKGNVSFNHSQQETSFDAKESQPSIGGWSPAQSIICATPRYQTVPSTPSDEANESLEQCSLKKIQQSQKKLLDGLYGDAWKSSLLKSISDRFNDINGITKKLDFDNDSDTESMNIQNDLKTNKHLYLTSSDIKQKTQDLNNTEKKSKKKLYTEKVPYTPDIPKPKLKTNRTANTTSKKKKGMTVTELVETLKTDVDNLTKKVNKVTISSHIEHVKRLSFMASLADNVPPWRCHIEAIQYRDDFKALREQLTRRLYVEFNKHVFDDALDADMSIAWDTKLRSTAGMTINRLIKTANNGRIRTSSIKLSTKVLDRPQRLRNTLIHELCHAATWLIDGELKARHGPLWKKWAKQALMVFPELEDIPRCHTMDIHFKYTYKCTKCGYSIQRHSKSIDITKKACGYCRGTFEIIINKKNKDGLIVSTPARKGEMNDFAKYVKENYSTTKVATKTHAQVMKLLGEQFSAKKNKNSKVIVNDEAF
ncbi:HMG box-containing protein C19G7.04-like [Hyposmocoma kahamanoa]|uniref:HMG box-containing protein C19G7.04-like n=1 Tax=Hyposmocoma kahamanoa TaxID=1477025 RepID=UPI000E6D5AE7|nr:HMG box-containing protein C19G7.04-like [Hyposmocoma kahamanoa]